MRSAGVLLPITALPSKYGIGCFSNSAYEFVDWLEKAGQSFWQVLPMSPTGYGDSPYQSVSSFAGNPYFISLEDLIKEGLLTANECEVCEAGPGEYIDYGRIYTHRIAVLQKAYSRSNVLYDEEYRRFLRTAGTWLDEYALFMAMKEYFGGKPWYEWSSDIFPGNLEAFETYRELLCDKIDFFKYTQYKFYQQWKGLKKYANLHGISVIGDIPIYTSLDSSDVLFSPELFELDEYGIPKEVAGCPPDGFSATGQLWGNPIYRWRKHEESGYSWWIKRLSHCFDTFDAVRIDHFRGFDEYYTVRYGSSDAKDGEWKKGPGKALFDAVYRALGEKKIIAEDLGFVTESVKKLLRECGFPGMRVLEFGFDSRDQSGDGEHLPHNFKENCVAYTGTHDNQTLYSWFLGISDEEKNAVRKYLCNEYTPDTLMNYPLISLVLMSPAKLAIIPVQDYLLKDDRARINTPSTPVGNWRWRFKNGDLTDGLAKDIYTLCARYGRCGR